MNAILSSSVVSITPREPQDSSGMINRCKLFFQQEKLNVLACVISTYVLSDGLLFKLSRVLMQNGAIRPSSFISEKVKSICHETQVFSEKIIYLLAGMKSEDPSNPYRAIPGAIIEEITDRVILQELLLKRLPKTILQKYAPKQIYLIDHPVVRVARVFLSSLHFAIIHTHAYHRDEDLYPYIMAGVVFGTLQEINGHPAYNMIAHVAANTLSLSGLVNFFGK
jgi:hypothetical protein